MGPLLQAFGIEGHLLIAQLVNFGVLFLVLLYLLYRPVMKTLDERRKVIAKGVEDAQEASASLAGANEKASEITRTAESDAEGIVARARDEAGTERERLVRDAQARAESIEKDAQARAQEAQDRALRESEKEIARLAILAAEKAMRQSAKGSA
ncbi:MAG TPA: ATP synthase F0 subunit B [Candidatus Paceibacterota bacterium]|nr:ATP synthase F0 subunit B [Candidatus Paceibacterota bacterium]